MVKKISYFLIVLLFGTILYAASGTPSTLRVNTDSLNNLLVTGSTLTGTTTSSVFSNTRLNTDSSGNLLVVLAASTSPFIGPTATDCSVVTYTFTGRLTTGLNSHAANTWNLCGGGTLGLSGNTTTVSSPLAFTAAGNISSSGGNIIGNNIVGASFQFQARADGVVTLADIAGTSFTRLQLGGTTSSFPSIKRNATAINFRLADDSADAPISAAAAVFSGSATAVNYFVTSGAGYILTNPFVILTAPTIASGGCTSPAVTWSNGTATFLITIGSSCTGVKTFVLTLPASAHFWSCRAVNNTSDAAQQTNYEVARATSTTAVTVTSYDRVTGLQEDYTAADTILMSCSGG